MHTQEQSAANFDVKRFLMIVVLPIVFGYAIAYAVTGCGATLEEIDKSSGETSAKLQKCRGEARAEFYVGQKSEEEALRVYEACKKREGL